MIFKTDRDEAIDVSIQGMLNVLTDAGVILANSLSEEILAIEECDLNLVVRWKSQAHPMMKSAIEKAWMNSPIRFGNVIHEESP